MIKVLITGGSGFIGTHLTRLLLKKGYHVEHLGRTRNSKAGVKTWLWDTRKQYIEEGAFDLTGFSGFYLVHLAGEGIIDRPWTEARKKSIIDSRVKTITLLYNECVKRNVFPLAVASAGGIAYYGMVTTEKIFEENDPPVHDFVGTCCIEWEKAARQFEKHVPVGILRTPLVLDKHEGGLPQMDRKILGIRPIIGSGLQWVPFVHIHDICRAYVHLLENRLNDTYNVAAPVHTNYRGLVRALASAGRARPGFYLPVKVPVWAVKLLYGERHALVTEGSRMSTQKLLNTGFVYDFPEIGPALADIYR